MSNKIKERNEVSDNFKWKITDLYENDNLWQDDFNSISQKINELNAYKGRVSIDNVLELFALKDKIGNVVEKIYVYANLKAHEDSSNTFYQGLSDKADSLITLYSSNVSYIEPELLSLDETKLLNAVSNTVYLHYIEDLLRSKEHILSAEKEELLAQVYEIEQAPDNIFSMLNNADLTFDDAVDKDGNKHPLTHGKYSSYLESTDRELRKSAFKSYYKSFYAQKNTIAAIYSASVKKDVFNARVRNYDSSLNAALEPYNIPVDVYKNLVKTVEKYLPLLHRYISLRKKRLGLDTLHFYDLYTPIVNNIDTAKEYESAKNTVRQALIPLGEEYLKTLNEGLDGGWIDVYENKGKRSGAYAWGSYGTHPFVSLNYDNTVNSMFTLIHEMGHAMHSHYTWSTQPYVYGDYTIFVAEVASTVNEALLMEHLLKTTKDENQKLYLINYFMEQFRGTLFRQTMFAEFELIAHEKCEEGEPLTFDALTEIYKQLNIKYYGNDIELDEEINYEWMRIPHFYSAFYVYQYATGYSAAIALSQKILNENGSENYIKFLKGGSSDYSINLLKTAGVDMSATAPTENALKVFENLLKQMENLS